MRSRMQVYVNLAALLAFAAALLMVRAVLGQLVSPMIFCATIAYWLGRYNERCSWK